MPLSPGTVVGNYRVLESLGSGGMGHVYKVQNLLYNRVEAMKVLRSELTSDQDISGRFLREIQVQAALIHPNIAALHTAFEIHGHLLMLMEYVEGETLEARLARGPMEVDEAAGVATQVLNALEYAHQQQVIHRDIKPANIILANSGVVKLMDFGLAAAGFDRKITRSGAVMGSLSYMSPEQVRGVALGPQSDLYSFGLTLYEMLTGVRGIEGDSDYDVMTAHLETTPRAPSQMNSAIPKRTNDVVMRAISKDAGARFSSAAEFREALTNASAVTPPQGSSEAPVEPVRAGSHAKALWIGAGVGLALVLAGAWVYWASRSEPVVEQVSNKPAPPAVEAPAQAPPAQPKASPPPVNPEPQAKSEPVAPPPVVNKAAEKSVPQAKAPATSAAPSIGAVPPPEHGSPAPVAVTPTNAPPVVNPAPSASKATPAPPKPTSPPPPAVTPVDVAGTNQIIASLLGQLQAAYASRDMNQVRVIFPTITSAHEARLREFLKSARTVELRLEPVGQATVSRDWAVVECRHWITAKFSNGSQQKPVESRAVIRLVRGAGGWVIDSITFTERGKSLYPPV